MTPPTGIHTLRFLSFLAALFGLKSSARTSGQTTAAPDSAPLPRKPSSFWCRAHVVRQSGKSSKTERQRTTSTAALANGGVGPRQTHKLFGWSHLLRKPPAQPPHSPCSAFNSITRPGMCCAACAAWASPPTQPACASTASALRCERKRPQAWKNEIELRNKHLTPQPFHPKL
jgi:alkylated DNA nucleotide flippase Atl1